MKSEGEVSAIHPAPKVVKMAKSHFYFAGLLAPLIKIKEKELYLVHCHKCVWKICEKCKTVFNCTEDVGGNLTDVGMHEWLDKNKGKNINDYKKEKIELLEHKYSDFKLIDHPKVENDPNIEYSDTSRNRVSVKLLY